MNIGFYLKKYKDRNMTPEDFDDFFNLLYNNQELLKKLPEDLKNWFEIEKTIFENQKKFENFINQFKNHAKLNLIYRFFNSSFELAKFYRKLLENQSFVDFVKNNQRKLNQIRFELIYILKILFNYNENIFLDFIENAIITDIFEDNNVMYYFENINQIIAINFNMYNNRLADFYAILFLLKNRIFYCPEIDQLYFLDKENMIIFKELTFEFLYEKIPILDSFNNSLISFRRFRERFLHTIKFHSEKIKRNQIKSAITSEFIVAKNKIINYKKNEFYDNWFEYFYQNQINFNIFIKCLNVEVKENLINLKLDPNKFLIDKFLSDISGNDINSDIFRLLGGIFCQYIKNKIFLMVGTGANGKSVLINIITHMFKGLNIGMTLDQFSKGNPEFIFYKLFNKLLVSGSEPGKLSDDAISILKKLHLSFEDITARKPYSSKSITFTPRIVSIFAMNHIPFNFYDSAFERRLFIIIFKKIIPKNKRIENLDSLIYNNNNEMSRFFGICYAMFQKILKCPKLLDQDNVSLIIEDRLDPINEFCNNYLEFVQDSEVEIDDLYQNYEKYCIDKSIAPVSRRKFVYLVRKHFGLENIKRKQKQQNAIRYYVLTNLAYSYSDENENSEIDLIDFNIFENNN